jgi:hypothetical protein
MKCLAILICCAGLASAANAQLTTGPIGLTIKAGTPFNSQGLVLTPATDLILQNDTIRLSGTPLTVESGASIARVYTISPSITFSGTVGIRYTAAELNGNQENTLAVIKAGPGAGFLALTSLTGSTGSYYVYSPGPGNFALNRVTATSTGVPLAIRYHSFTATAEASCSTKLSWIAAQAQPDNFHIERSQNGKTFRSLHATVLRSGEQFSLTDPSPLPGRNIYRLTIDEPGKPLLYSTMITINNPCTIAAQIKIYPNPAKESISLALGNQPDGVVTIDLLDITGKLIKTFQTTDQVSTLDLQGIVPGSYFLKVQNGSLSENIKIIKL